VSVSFWIGGWRKGTTLSSAERTMMEEGNYSKFCGKNNDGIRKKQVAAILAEKMTKETISTRDAKSVLCKIQHIERT
jgi:hypothetical protein